MSDKWHGFPKGPITAAAADQEPEAQRLSFEPRLMSPELACLFAQVDAERATRQQATGRPARRSRSGNRESTHQGDQADE